MNKTRITFPEDYQFGDDLRRTFNGHVADASQTYMVVNVPPEIVQHILSSRHAGLREDIADHTIMVSPAP